MTAHYLTPNSVFDDHQPVQQQADITESADTNTVAEQGVESAVSKMEKRRLLKAFHAFKCDPSEYNFNRIARVVSTASDAVYVENAVSSFAQSISNKGRYVEFLHSFDELQQNNE